MDAPARAKINGETLRLEKAQRKIMRNAGRTGLQLLSVLWCMSHKG
jgi:hypothetical protein